ncbi:MAG: glutamate-1-semialdehyde-2,1-aminomutase [Candidatus Firestonebacteria bacterium RIFOXYC2_FULL_39_67]|nr:MAG: glutamate-1-semialdehyde-2,1-aminomutase [Candidatus Firestonebacteria bacterium RIFOXYC2_FULL_39_67]
MNKNKQLFLRTKKHIPGGVNSPVRAFKAVGGTPVFFKRGKGSKLFDVNGKEYIDYVGSWGPLILGHCDSNVVKAVKRAAESGTSFGAPTEAETILAEMITSAIPSIELIRFVNSGTEAVMSAIRLARAFTGKENIIKFEGCYHGHSDSMLVNAGSGLATFGIPSSPGVPSCLAEKTISLPYNDVEKLESKVKELKGNVACIIVEPIAANMGLVLPEKGFLASLRRAASENGIILIFDEVITGFRLRYGSVSKIYNISPDLICLGKIIGGGLPVGAYGGRKDIMRMISPEGPVYQAGTLSGNPLAMAGGIFTLKALRDNKDIYKQLDQKGNILEDGIRKAINKNSSECALTRIGSMFTLFFTGKIVRDYVAAKQCDTGLYARYFKGMLKSGVYLPPSQFETSFISTAHSEKDIEKTIKSNYLVLKRWKRTDRIL